MTREEEAWTVRSGYTCQCLICQDDKHDYSLESPSETTIDGEDSETSDKTEDTDGFRLTDGGITDGIEDGRVS